MWHLAGRASLRLFAGLLGTALLAAAVAALPQPGGHAQTASFLADWLHQLDAFAHLDFGSSQITGASAVDAVMYRLPLTLALVGGGALVALMLGVPFGLLSGVAHRLQPAVAMVQIMAAMPVFCAALLLLWVAGHGFGWHTARQSGVVLWSAAGAPADPAAWLQALALPAVMVGLAGGATVQMALRRAAARLDQAPFRAQLRLLGLPPLEADASYLWRPLAAALCAAAGEILLALFAAAAVAEWVFGWPGVAALFVKSVALGDWGVAALVLAILAALKLAADLAGGLAAAALLSGEFEA